MNGTGFFFFSPSRVEIGEGREMGLGVYLVEKGGGQCVEGACLVCGGFFR